MTATRRRRAVVLLRPIPGTSFVHELWAGTKLIVVFVLSLMLAFYPGWIPIGLAAALVVAALILARVPAGAWPSIPRWLWLLLLLGGVLAAVGGGDPLVHLGSVDIPVGGLLKFLRFTALSIVLVVLGMLVSWTTDVADVAPAVSTLGRPLRLFRIPIDEWAVALALALRAFPMLIDEFRLLYAARRLRPRPVMPDGSPQQRRRLSEIVDLVAAGITVALRRADEMGDAITARGGTGQFCAAPSRPGLKDWVVLAVVFAVCVLGVLLEIRYGG